MSHCGLEPKPISSTRISGIFDFNTPAVVTALGAAISQSSQEVLRQIGATIKHHEYERSQANERTVIYTERGLSNSRPILEEQPAKPWASTARMRKTYLKEYRTVLYSNLPS